MSEVHTCDISDAFIEALEDELNRPSAEWGLVDPKAIAAAVLTLECDLIAGVFGVNPLAASLGRSGGKVGGRARADSMTAEERSECARKAANARWNQYSKILEKRRAGSQ